MIRGKKPGPIRPAAVRHSRSKAISVYTASTTRSTRRKTVLPVGASRGPDRPARGVSLVGA